MNLILGNKQQDSSETKLLKKLKAKLSKNYFSEIKSEYYVGEIEENGFGKISNNSNIPIYILSPYSRMKLAWDTFLAIIIIFEFLFMPIDLGFTKECLFTETVYNIIEKIKLIVYLLLGIDFMMTFITALVDDKGQYNYNIKEIAMSYIQTSKFVFDFLAVFPFEIIIKSKFVNKDCFKGNFDFARQLKLFLIIRVSKLSRLNTIIEKLTPTKQIPIFRLLKLLLVYFYLIYFIGVIFTSYSPSLIKIFMNDPDFKNHIYHSDTSSFVNLLSFCIFTGVFIVLGNDLNLSESYERILIILINIVSLVANGYVFGYIANLLKGTNENDIGISSALDKIKEFVNFHQFSPNLKEKLEKYYTIMYKRQRNYFLKDELFSDCSDLVLSFAKYEMWKEIYFKFDKFFIKDNISPEFFNESLKYMKAKIYIENERILNEGEKSYDLYFVTSGAKCQITIHGIIVDTLKEGDSFGEIAVFLQSGRRSASATSLFMSDYVYIPGKVFLKLLRDFPKEAELIKKKAIDSFYKTFSMTRINSVTRLLGDDQYEPIFKKNLYSGIQKTVEKEKYEIWNLASINDLIKPTNKIILDV